MPPVERLTRYGLPPETPSLESVCCAASEDTAAESFHITDGVAVGGNGRFDVGSNPMVRDYDKEIRRLKAKNRGKDTKRRLSQVVRAKVAAVRYAERGKRLGPTRPKPPSDGTFDGWRDSLWQR